MVDANLEQMIGAGAIDDIVRPEFAIDPVIVYNRDTFVKHAGSLFDLTEAYGELKKNSGNFDALYDLIDVLRDYVPGDLGANLQVWENTPSEAIKQANTLEKQGSKAMGKFVERKRGNLLNKLSAEQLHSLFQTIPIYKGDNPAYERIRTIREKIYDIQEKAQNGGDPSAVVAEDVHNLIQHSSADKQEFIMRNHKAMMSSLTNAVIKAITKEYQGLFKTANGNLIKNQIKGFLEDNYQIADDFVDSVPNSEKDKYWNDNLKPQYLEIAKMLYGSEKKAQKYAANPAKETRKAQAKAIGLRA